MEDRITLEQYFGPYLGGGEDTPEMRANALALLGAVNGALELAAADGLPLPVNPTTRSRISGSGHGGFRDHACSVGAANSRHRRARAVDVYDPNRALAAWAVKHHARLVELGIFGMERPEWTPTWVHFQIEWVRSRTWCYVPSADVPLVSTLPEQAFLDLE